MDDWLALRFIFDADPQRLVIGTGDNGNEIGVYDSTAWKMFGTITDTTSTNNFAIVVDGTTAKCFLNGQSFGTDQTITAINLSNPTNVALGSRNDTATSFLNGQMSGFKIFNTALTAAQVADLYNNPEKVVPTGVANTALKLFLPMQEGAGTTAYDGSGNGNHGTISGATYTHGIGAPVAQTAVIDWNKGTNLAANSAQLDQFSVIDRLTISTNQESISGYDDAFLLTPTAVLGSHRIYQNITTTSAVHSVSFYAKANGLNKVMLFVNGQNQGVIFNLDSVTTTSFTKYNATPATNQTIQDKGNGWYYCGLTTAVGTSAVVQIQLYDDATTPDNSWTGDGVNGMYIYGLSFITADNIGPYVPTLSTAQTSEVLLPQGLTTGRDITGVNLFENVRKQGALNLDGNSWAEVHDNASLDVTTGASVEAWVYWDGTQADKGIIGKWRGSDNLRGYLLYVQSLTEARFFVSSNGLDSYNVATSTTILNGWNHIVGISDGSKIKIYLNGIFENEVSASTIFSSSLPLEIGRFKTDSNAAYENEIAQPRIYNRALTAAEVLQNYNSGKNTYK